MALIQFQSTPPARGATTHEEAAQAGVVFQSTPPARGATVINVRKNVSSLEFQSTPPARGATRDWLADVVAVNGISIHAPREGGDCVQRPGQHPAHDFNPRPPRGGRRHLINSHTAISIFQSTPPARGATKSMYFLNKSSDNFNPRPPRGGRQRYLLQKAMSVFISIHAPREGGDVDNPFSIVIIVVFQSTPPARGATSIPLPGEILSTDFNPRPPRGGRPLRGQFFVTLIANFNPRPPRGGRQRQADAQDV